MTPVIPMNKEQRISTPLWEDEWFRLEATTECTVPGYLVLRLKGPAPSLGRLAPGAARRLGAVMARVAAAIEAATGAERVYVLSFCEVDPHLHFHLFPRTRWLAEAWRQAHPGDGEPVDGPRLFTWARAEYAPGRPLPHVFPEPAAVLDLLRRRLGGA
jgi:diadenosine tetraphosphate (Ap4A) HIT family hydrolase